MFGALTDWQPHALPEATRTWLPGSRAVSIDVWGCKYDSCALTFTVHDQSAVGRSPLKNISSHKSPPRALTDWRPHALPEATRAWLPESRAVLIDVWGGKYDSCALTFTVHGHSAVARAPSLGVQHTKAPHEL